MPVLLVAAMAVSPPLLSLHPLFRFLPFIFFLLTRLLLRLDVMLTVLFAVAVVVNLSLFRRLLLLCSKAGDSNEWRGDH